MELENNNIIAISRTKIFAILNKHFSLKECFNVGVFEVFYVRGITINERYKRKLRIA